jgi:hypothetical protein
MTKIRSRYTEVNKEMQRIASTPERARPALEAVLRSGFKSTQAVVHVITGSLKLSGKLNSYTEGDTWVGEISYGGVSLGVNNPVTYAIYEKARDGDHDFFTPLRALDTAYVNAILRVL